MRIGRPRSACVSAQFDHDLYCIRYVHYKFMSSENHGRFPTVWSQIKTRRLSLVYIVNFYVIDSTSIHDGRVHCRYSGTDVFIEGIFLRTVPKRFL